MRRSNQMNNYIKYRIVLDSFREQMIDCTLDFISAMKIDKTHDFLDLFNGLTLKILCKTAMGLDIDFEDPKAKQYRDDVERIKARLLKCEKTSH